MCNLHEYGKEVVPRDYILCLQSPPQGGSFSFLLQTNMIGVSLRSQAPYPAAESIPPFLGDNRLPAAPLTTSIFHSLNKTNAKYKNKTPKSENEVAKH